jgi:hypothetical protein
MGTPTDDFIRALTSQHRVLVLGGLAVIAHGFSRPTKDADIWLEPMADSTQWAEALARVCVKFPGVSIHKLPEWQKISATELATVIEETGVVRVLGLDCPLDIFRRPNEFPESEFDEVFSRATPNADGTRLPDPLDLIVTKLDTGRPQDLHDSQFLETLVRKDYMTRIPTSSLDQVRAMFSRFVDWEVCQIALQSPDEQVREFARETVAEMAAEGDPFAQALLEGSPIPYQH